MAEKTIKLNLEVDSSKGENSIRRTSTKIKALGATAAVSGAAIGTGSKIASGGMLLLGASTASTLSKLKDQYRAAGKAADQAKKTSNSMVDYARAMHRANDAATKLGKEIKKGNKGLGKQKDVLGGGGAGLIGAWNKYKLAILAVSTLLGYGFYRGVKSATIAASDLQEVQGKFDVVFKDQIDIAEKWATTLVDSYLMSTREAKQYLSSVQDLLVPMGMASDEAGRMSMEVVKLSAELGSFNNLPTASVMNDITSALTGSFETMKKHGVILNETVIKQEAFNRGLWDGKGMVDANTKAFVAFQLMMKGSAAAIGDVERTSGSYANQLKKLKSNIEDINSAIGTELLPIITKWVVQVNTMIKNNPELIKQIGSVTKGILELATALGKLSLDFFSDFQYSMLGITLAKSGFITWAESMNTDMVRLYHQTGLNLKQREDIEDVEKRLHIAQVGYNRAERRGHEANMSYYDERIKKLTEELRIKRSLGKKISKIFGTDKPEPTVLETITVTAAEIPTKKRKHKKPEGVADYAEGVEAFRQAQMTQTEIALDALSEQYYKHDVFVKDKAALDKWYADSKKAILAPEIAQRAADHEKVLQYISTEEENALRAINNERDAMLELATTYGEVAAVYEASALRKQELDAQNLTALEEWASKQISLSEQIQQVTIHAAEAFSSGMTDALFEFAEGTKTAEEAFRSFAVSFLKQISKILIQYAILETIKRMLDNTSTTANAKAVAGNTAEAGSVAVLTKAYLALAFAKTLAGVSGGGGGGGGGGGATTAAKGGVFHQGHKMMEYAKGGIVNKPTIFPMANGAGLMGEAGPEAIMPLKRGKDGKLGVEGGGSNTINTTINVTTGGEGENQEDSKRRGKEIAMALEVEFNKNLMKQMRPGGLLNQQ